jgi:Nif-specific regulatory protein
MPHPDSSTPSRIPDPAPDGNPEPDPAPGLLRHLEEALGDLEMAGEVARTVRAVVHRVRLGRLGDRPLALKLALQPSERDDLARFRHEARLLSEVRHPNVVEVHDLGVLPGGYPYLVMELVEPYAVPEAPPWEEVYDLGVQAAAGLAHIHHHRVVHLDVKPGNLGIAPDGGTGGRRLKILDFGLAQELRGPLDRRIRGTLAYTAPEVLLQDRYDHRADLYSLGLTLLQIATGTLPSAGGDREALLYHLTAEAPTPDELRRLRPDMPEALAEILARLLRRDPAERYASAGRLLEALGRAAGREIDPGALALGTGGVLASRLVGRAQAVARLGTELAAARRGEARVLAVEGAEGIGKSRLLREFRLLAAVDGARVAFGRASAEGGRPLQPFLQALDQLGVSVEPTAGTEAPLESGPPRADAPGRFRLFREISRRLAEASRLRPEAPLVLLLDDLHLAGRESAELLDFLARDLGSDGAADEEADAAAEGAHVLVVASRRPREPADDAGAPVLPLAPLPREATGELLDASLGVEAPGTLPEGLRDWIHEASEGLPGRVQQLLRHLIDEGDLVFRGGEWKPRRAALARLTGREAAEALAWRRLASLDEGARRLLEGAAVVGEPVSASALAELLEEPVEGVWEGLAALAEQGFLERLMEPGGAAYVIAGSRLRDGLYATLEPARRGDLHLRLGEALGRRVDAGEGELAAGAAEHLWRAGRRAESLPYLLAAARDAAAVHGHAEAASLFGRAAEAAEEAGDPAAAFEARSGQARALALAGHPGRALRLYQQLLETGPPPEGPAPRAHARLCLENGRLHGRLGEHRAALAAFEDGLAAAEPEGELAIELLHGKAVALRDLGRAAKAVETARAALRRTRSGGPAGGRATLARQRALLVNTLAQMDFARGDLRRAGRLARWGLRGALGTGDRYLAIVLRNTLAMARWKTGDFAAASALFAENLAAADALNDPWAQLPALNNLGILHCGRGEWREARRLLGRSLEMNRRLGAREGEALARINLGEVEEALGDLRRARRHGQRALALLEGSAESPDHRSSSGGARVAARLLLASVARKSGDLDEAGDHVRNAMAGAEATGDRDLAVQALYQRGLLEADRGSAERAREDLERALEGFEELGAGPDAERARQALTSLEERRSSPDGGAVAGRPGDGEAGTAPGAADPTLPEVMKVINSSLDLGEVLDRTMDLALERLGAERGMIVFADPLTRELEVAVARNLGGDGEAGGRGEERQLSESVVRRVIEKNEPVVAVDAPADSRFAGAESIVASHILSILCVPLAIRDRLEGAIYVDHCRARHLFRQADVEFLRSFADGAAVAIQNARLYGELEEARRRLETENRSLRREIRAAHHLGSLIGKSRAIEELKGTLERVAQSSSTVLIRGESGTGKGLVARIIHNISPRRGGPFIHFNCAALPETLVESELFGHEKGAFTGATERKPGRFELAHEGTVFLDEIGKVSKAIQAKLLRVVEDKEFERVGGTRTQRSDVRIITATNLDLEQAIARDDFREDLYYRLNIIPIVLPPLRERREDVPDLARHFLERIARDLGQSPRELDPAALELFLRHPWPGNVREIESAIHRALVLSTREVLTAEDFAWIAVAGGDGAAAGDPAAALAGAMPEQLDLEEGRYQELLDGFDRRLVQAALERCDGKIRETARVLGIARNTLKAKMQRYGLEA